MGEERGAVPADEGAVIRRGTRERRRERRASRTTLGGDKTTGAPENPALAGVGAKEALDAFQFVDGVVAEVERRRPTIPRTPRSPGVLAAKDSKDSVRPRKVVAHEGHPAVCQRSRRRARGEIGRTRGLAQARGEAVAGAEALRDPSTDGPSRRRDPSRKTRRPISRTARSGGTCPVCRSRRDGR